MSVRLDGAIGKNFCYAPWTNIHITTNGSYQTCCGANTNIGNLRKIPITELIQSNVLTDIKHNLVNNQTDSNCKNCLIAENFSNNSERTWYNDIAESKSLNVTNIGDFYLQNLDIRWSNTCNLSCVYCNQTSSSQWAMLDKKPQERIDYTDTISDIVNFIKQHNSTLKNIALLGGEPLLQKENELLLDLVSNDVHINVITNLSVPLENNKIFKKLLLKEKVMWDVSFETVEDQFDYVRHGSSWALMYKNLKYLQEAVADKPNHRIGITSQYCIYNALDLVKLHEYFKDYNLPDMRWNQLTSPDVLSVSLLPNKYLKQAIDQLEKSIKFHPGQATEQNPSEDPIDHVNGKFLSDMANSLRSIQSAKLNTDYLYSWHQIQETKYWPTFPLKFEQLWPEYRE